jgi:hypothetical protein
MKICKKNLEFLEKHCKGNAWFHDAKEKETTLSSADGKGFYSFLKS